MKQITAVEWLESELNIWQTIADEDTNATLDVVRGWIDKLKAMEKEQIRDAFVECWKANVPDGVECKLDAEEYYNETFKSE